MKISLLFIRTTAMEIPNSQFLAENLKRFRKNVFINIYFLTTRDLNRGCSRAVNLSCFIRISLVFHAVVFIFTLLRAIKSLQSLSITL